MLDKDNTTDSVRPHSQRLIKHGGYCGYTHTSKYLILIFNVSLACLFCLLGLPVFLVIAAIIKIRNDGPILYSGPRLGMYKKTFIMYKFRTLPVGTDQKLGSELFHTAHGKLPFFAKFLRDTRLDELPQLFNILKGEMDFIGPRPLRPKVYEAYCQGLPHYDRRFEVRPGLIGYSQLFTPHSSPKRIRNLIDNHSICYKRSLSWDLVMVFLTLMVVGKSFFFMLVDFICTNVIRSKILGQFKDKRMFDRIRVKDSKTYLFENNKDLGIKDPVVIGHLIDINEKHLKLVTNKKLEQDTFEARIYTPIKRGKRYRHKVAQCRVTVFKHSYNENKTRHVYILSYEPLTDFQQYMIDQYFLKKSLMK